MGTVWVRVFLDVNYLGGKHPVGIVLGGTLRGWNFPSTVLRMKRLNFNYFCNKI